MTAALASRRGKAPEARDLLLAACRIVASDGWAGLTLRPLAQHLQVSVTVLSNHYGTRADVIAAICNAAHTEQLQLLANWRQFLLPLGRLSASTAADLSDTILEELATHARDFSLLFMEVIQASRCDAALHLASAPWLDEHMRFWAQLGGQAGMPATLAGSGWLGGYAIDELAYSISLNHLPAYRMLRRQCLRRLFSGVLSASGSDGDALLFQTLFDALAYRADEVSVIHGVDFATDWPGRAARACALTLTERGVSALTHRAIAAEAGVPHTTLSYRYSTQQDLVVAGLEYIISHLLRAVDADAQADAAPRSSGQACAADKPGLDVGRATFALAVAAARMPQLVPSAADMRRSRGVNLLKILRRISPPIPHVDMLGAQIAAIGLIGLANTLPEAQQSRLAAAYESLLAYFRA